MSYITHRKRNPAHNLGGADMNASTLAIRIASENGTLRIVEREGRFGTFFAICDDNGTIEVADTRNEANDICEVACL